MATTKKTTIIESDEPVTETQPVQVVSQSSGMSKQGIITIAIVSGVVLFFFGMGLGYLCGHNLRDSRYNMMGNQLNREGDDNYGGMMRGGYYRGSAQQTTPNSTGTTNNQTAPQTQSN